MLKSHRGPTVIVGAGTGRDKCDLCGVRVPLVVWRRHKRTRAVVNSEGAAHLVLPTEIGAPTKDIN